MSRTDPDARLATSGGRGGFEPTYKQHAAVDDARGLVLDVSVTEGTVNEREVIESHMNAVRELSGREAALVTADSGYAYSKVYGALERRGVAALIPAKEEPSQSRVPLRLFRYDARNDIVKCPRGKILSPRRTEKRGRYYGSKTRDCARVGAIRGGSRRSGGCTGAICGVRRATTARRRPGAGFLSVAA